MRGRVFFFFFLAAIVTVVLAIAGVFGPLNHPTPEQTAESVKGGISERASLPLPGVTAPAIRWTGDAKVGDNGRVHLSFRAEASSPLSSLQLKIAPVNPPEGNVKIEKETRDIPTWLIGNKAIDWDGDIDLTGSFMAGQPVAIQVVATDEDKRSGTSEAVKVNLPEHHFTQPVAQALYTLRKGLQQDPSSRRNDALRALAGLLQQRNTFDNQELALLTLRSAAVRIALDNSEEGMHSALDLIWHAALLFEDSPATNVTVSLRMSPKPEPDQPSKPEKKRAVVGHTGESKETVIPAKAGIHGINCADNG